MFFKKFLGGIVKTMRLEFPKNYPVYTEWVVTRFGQKLVSEKKNFAEVNL